MSSILTNMSAMSAVQNLTATQKNLATTENQISTGLRVATAKDNAAYWSIATSMKTTNIANSSISDSLNLGASILGTASSALGNVVSLMQKMVADLTTAQTSKSADLDKIGTDIGTLQNQLKSTLDAASFNGVNLLEQTTGGTTNATQNFIATSVTGSGSTFAVTTLVIDYANTALVAGATGATGATQGILGVNGAASSKSILQFSVGATSTAGDIAALLKDVNGALASVQTVAATLGAYQTNIDLQSTFISTLSDSISSGIGSLEDADMNQASTRLNALQTQQQLGIQALSVANQNSQIILKLFGG